MPMEKEKMDLVWSLVIFGIVQFIASPVYEGPNIVW